MTAAPVTGKETAESPLTCADRIGLPRQTAQQAAACGTMDGDANETVVSPSY
jgi:hypothetical protein